VTVALSGQGADELLGGYPKHRAAALAGRWAWVPRPVRRVGGAAASGAGGRAGRLARVLAEDDPVERLLLMSGKLDAGLRAELYRGRLAAVDGGAARRAVRSRLNGVRARPLETTLYLDSQLALVDDMLHYFDRASMAQSLEVRVPFLDHVLVEFCARMPAQYKVRGLRTKHVLKEAARDLLPASVIDKRKIGFFHDSLDAWFRRQADDAVAKYLLAPDARYRDLMDGSAVEALVRRQQKAGGHAYLALSILMLEVWLRSFLPRATGSGAASSRLAVA
jgi:asparagine synthase (glutamine-hydrolysing)